MKKTSKSPRKALSDDQRERADAEIKRLQSEVSFNIKDFVVDYIVSQFNADLFYIPEYQREFVWKPKHRSEFIESMILGLPIPMMFVADMPDGRMEIVDGAQRIQTLEAFVNDDLRLSGLTKLQSLNGFRYRDLPISQQRKFATRALRIVVLDDKTTPQLRQELFNRINTRGVKARASEVRRGAFVGPFMEFIDQCSNNSLFQRLCPINKALQERREPQELVLRFFAYSDEYRRFKHDVEPFLNEFVERYQYDFPKDRFELEYNQMLKFVKNYFPFGFAKTANAKATPRVRFEAISIGVNLALREQPLLNPSSLDWLTSKEFEDHTTTHASNSATRLQGRVEYVRDQLLRSQNNLGVRHGKRR